MAANPSPAQIAVGGNFRTHALIFPEPDIAMIIPVGLMRLMMWMVFPMIILCPVAGAAAITLLVFGASTQTTIWIAEGVLALSVLAALYLLPQFRQQIENCPLVFDRIRGTMYRRRRADPIFGDYALLTDIRAIRLRFWQQKGVEDPKTWILYEIDLLMARPCEARVVVMAHGDRDGIFDDAHNLGKFLNVPVLDQSEIHLHRLD